MAGLGAAGLLLVNLPASAQLSGDTSTFSGEVATTCSFEGLPDEAQLNYISSDNNLRGSAPFQLATNAASLRLEISNVTVNSEPMALNNSIVSAYGKILRSVSNQWTSVATSTKTFASVTASLDMSEGSNFSLQVYNITNNRDGDRYQLATGDYSYTVTLSCLIDP